MKRKGIISFILFIIIFFILFFSVNIIKGFPYVESQTKKYIVPILAGVTGKLHHSCYNSFYSQQCIACLFLKNLLYMYVYYSLGKTLLFYLFEGFRTQEERRLVRIILGRPVNVPTTIFSFGFAAIMAHLPGVEWAIYILAFTLIPATISLHFFFPRGSQTLRSFLYSLAEPLLLFLLLRHGIGILSTLLGPLTIFMPNLRFLQGALSYISYLQSMC